MDYKIVLPPDFGLTAVDFVDAWNNTADCRALTEARFAESSRGQFEPTTIAGMAILGAVALHVASDAIYDLIKRVLEKKGVHKRTEIKELDQPDGTHLLVVTIEEQ